MSQYQWRLPFHRRVQRALHRSGMLGRDVYRVRVGLWALSRLEFGVMLGESPMGAEETVRRWEMGLEEPKRGYQKKWIASQVRCLMFERCVRALRRGQTQGSR